MAKKKKQRKKKPTFAPPLSKTDKLIYKMGYLVIALLAMLLVVATIFLVEQIAFADDFAMASYSRGSFLLVLPFMMYAIISVLIFWYNAHSSRKPIFGNPDITYGKEPWQNFYPLFSKEHKKRVLRPSALKFRKKILSLWLGGFCACLILACFGLFGRVSLMQNGEITVYNSLNKEKETYSVMDVSNFEIRAEYYVSNGRHRRRHTGYWRLVFEFEMTDGKSHDFKVGDFRSREDAFESMLKMKTLVDSRKITITGKENLDKVIDDHNYTSEELALLYELFEMTEE